MRGSASHPRKLEDKSSILATDAVRLKVLEDVISKEDWVMVEARWMFLAENHTNVWWLNIHFVVWSPSLFLWDFQSAGTLLIFVTWVCVLSLFFGFFLFVVLFLVATLVCCCGVFLFGIAAADNYYHDDDEDECLCDGFDVDNDVIAAVVTFGRN